MILTIYPLKSLLLCASWLILVCTAVELGIKSNSVLAQTIFGDLPENYWAKPFIQKLAARNIVVGYPDGKFRPQQPIKRDEFAAIIRQAFERKPKQEISSASKFADVPENHWAEKAIAEAYETGFMETTEGNSFSPNLPVSKLDAIVALTNGLEMSSANQNNLRTTPPVAKQPQVVSKHLAFPLASTTIMNMNPRMSLASTAIVAPLIRLDRLRNQPVSPSPLATVREYYEDTNLIPEAAIDNIAVATEQGMVVNYPQTQYLEPNEPLERGEATALVHQALVSIKKLPPLPRTTEALNYIVSP